MLSTLAKLGSRTFIVGFVLPTILGFCFGLLMFGDPVEAVDLLKDMKDPTTTLLLLLGGVWLLSVLLTMINHSLYKLFEGYYPPLSWLQGRAVRMRRHLENLRHEACLIDAEIAKGTAQNGEISRFNGILAEIAIMPASSTDMLPTRFGNAIRAFERYPNEVYGADGVSLWMHAASVAPSALVETAADARAMVDFMVNCTLFSFMIACGKAGQIIYLLPYEHLMLTIRAHDVTGLLRFAPLGSLGIAAAALAASYGFYLAAVALVPAWGQVVKACFDTGLPELAKKLGYELPPTQAERRMFWSEFSQTVVYRTRLDRSVIMSPEDWLSAKAESPKGLLAIIWAWLWTGR